MSANIEDPWSHDDLRRAAVEYTLQTCGDPPRGSIPAAYSGSLQQCAEALGVPPAALLNWIRNPAYLPPMSERPDLHSRDFGGGHRSINFVDPDDADDAYHERLATVPEIPPGATPAPTADALTQLLSGECDRLHAAERHAIALALESGDPLSRPMRHAIAVTLRGADMHTLRDTVSALLAFINPAGSAIRTLWGVRETNLSCPLGSESRTLPISIPIQGFPVMGSQILQINAGARLIRAIPYARARRTRTFPGRVEITIQQLIPSRQTFASETILRQMALLAAWVQNDPKDGTQWARLFGQTKQAVSWTRNKLADRIQTATSARTNGFRALRAKDDPRKDKTRPSA